jgi:hypothetical protein
MLYLQATQRARDYLGIGKEPLNPPIETSSKLGNWALNIVPIGSREALLFVNDRSLLNFPIMIGKQRPTLQDIPDFMSYGLKLLMQSMNAPQRARSTLLHELNEIRICKATNKSLLGAISAVAADYDHRVSASGGFAKVDIGTVVLDVNSTPRQTLGYRSSFEVSGELLAGSDA